MRRTSIFGEVLKGIGGIGGEILRQTTGVKSSKNNPSPSITTTPSEIISPPAATTISTNTLNTATSTGTFTKSNLFSFFSNGESLLGDFKRNGLGAGSM